MTWKVQTVWHTLGWFLIGMFSGFTVLAVGVAVYMQVTDDDEWPYP